MKNQIVRFSMPNSLTLNDFLGPSEGRLRKVFRKIMRLAPVGFTLISKKVHLSRRGLTEGYARRRNSPPPAERECSNPRECLQRGKRETIKKSEDGRCPVLGLFLR